MRVYADCYELMSEIFREVWEMGHIAVPNSMQNKVVTGNDLFVTKEITSYQYCLTNLFKIEYLFLADPNAIKWANAEFEERVAAYLVNPGTAWELRKTVWEEFLNEDGKFDYTYNERMRHQLPTIIDELLRNPDTRQAIVSVYDTHKDLSGVGGTKRIPCSLNYQFLYRNGRLNIIYNQRSADVVTHFGNDVYLAWKLMEYVAEKCGYRKGYLFHNIGSLHSYKKDWPRLKQCVEDIKI